MIDLNFFKNWDLLTLGIVIIVTVVLGFVVYLENPRSSMRRSFFGFAIWTAIWGTFNYLSYHLTPAYAFNFLKLTIFAVIWETYYFLRFSMVFPKEENIPRHKLSWVLWGIAWVVAVLTLTPFVFQEIGGISPSGAITQIINGPAMPLFGNVSVGFTLAGVILLLRKTLWPKDKAAKSYRLISVGVLVMFVLIITSNFVFPVFLNNSQYIQFGALFVFPFIALTSYAIIKNKVFNVKVLSAELFITALLILSFLQLIQSRELSNIILSLGILISLLGAGILLIKSVRKEVEQREELQKLSEELKAKNIQLDELNHFKTQLLSLASHQVKSPLSVIKQYVSLILDKTYGGDVLEPMEGEPSTRSAGKVQVKETLAKVKKSADGLIGLINTLLDLRKVEEGKMDYKFAPVDLVEIVSGVVEELRPLAAQNKLEFTLTAPAEKIMINADAIKLKQVIQNITDNAIKYTPSGYIKVVIEKKEGSVIVSAQDSGRGIPADLLPHLFEEFIRDEKVKQEILGTGLGLYIARRIVEAHGGKIWAESDGEGKGSTFFVVLQPIAASNT